MNWLDRRNKASKLIGEDNFDKLSKDLYDGDMNYNRHQGIALSDLLATIAVENVLVDRLENAEEAVLAVGDIIWMAEKYAEAGGNGPEQRDFNEAMEKFRPVLNSLLPRTVRG